MDTMLDSQHTSTNEQLQTAQNEVRKLTELLEKNSLVLKEREDELLQTTAKVQQLSAQVEANVTAKSQFQTKYAELVQKFEESERVVVLKCEEMQKIDAQLQKEVEF